MWYESGVMKIAVCAVFTYILAMREYVTDMLPDNKVEALMSPPTNSIIEDNGPYHNGAPGVPGFCTHLILCTDFVYSAAALSSWT